MLHRCQDLHKELVSEDRCKIGKNVQDVEQAVGKNLQSAQAIDSHKHGVIVDAKVQHSDRAEDLVKDVVTNAGAMHTLGFKEIVGAKGLACDLVEGRVQDVGTNARAIVLLRFKGIVVTTVDVRDRAKDQLRVVVAGARAINLRGLNLDRFLVLGKMLGVQHASLIVRKTWISWADLDRTGTT